MKKKSGYLLLVLLVLLLSPSIVWASSDLEDMSFLYFFEAFATIHFCVFFAIPVSRKFSSDDHKPLFWKIFFARVIILFIGNFIFNYFMIFIDVAAIIGGTIIFLRNGENTTSSIISSSSKICPKCNLVALSEDKYCMSCGTLLASSVAEAVVVPTNIAVVDEKFNASEKVLLDKMIDEEFKKNNYNDKYICSEIKNKQTILFTIFLLLNIVFVAFIFFHMPLYTLLLEVINVVVYLVFSKKFSIKNIIVKEIKNRPDEKISNIIASIMSRSFESNNRFILKAILIIISFLLPLGYFYNPHVFYESYMDGYYVRFYTFGISNFDTVYISNTYKGKPVYGIRGDVFSNMYLLKNVYIEEGIDTIRGTAFKNDINLEEVHLPKSLTYLGGEAFYNCSSLVSVNLGDTKITEVKGNTFENCTSLSSIIIPEGVTRIGGHAFRGDSKLSEVSIPSTVREIGSSAFRSCISLYTVSVPKEASINVRAFKESPTNVRRY